MKPLLWVSNSYKTLIALPRRVKQAAGFQLHLVQLGRDPDDWKPMPSIGAGVREIRIHVDGEHRIIYFAKFEKGVYILHVFQKKSQKTSKTDLDLAKSRFHEVIRQRTKP